MQNVYLKKLLPYQQKDDDYVSAYLNIIFEGFHIRMIGSKLIIKSNGFFIARFLLLIFIIHY